MEQALLHEELINACSHGNVDGVAHWLARGADPNFNLKSPSNALNAAIQNDDHPIIRLLLENGAVVKEFVLQKAIEKDRNYLHLLVPDFSACTDEALLIGALQAAINISDVDLAKQAIDQGAKPEALFIYAIQDLDNTEILALLLDHGFNLHADANKMFNLWMGSSESGSWRNNRPAKLDVLAFISGYYLDKPDALIKFTSSILQKSLLFRLGLGNNILSMMKFAVLIGTNKNEALNSALNRYYAINRENTTRKIDYDIIEFLLNATTEFTEITISNAVFFKYREVLNALRRRQDLEYGYEIAYSYDKNDLCEFFIERGVSKKAQCVAKMKVSAIKGNLKALRKAVNEGADVNVIDTDVMVEVINKNHVEVLKYLHESGLFIDPSFNQHLNEAMRQHEAYDTLSFLIEQGLDITNVTNMPKDYKKQYPVFADMWEKGFSDIFDYTVYLAKEVHPKARGKKKEEILTIIAELSTLPYVVKMSQEKPHGD